MIETGTEEYIKSHFRDELENPKRNVYFDQYFSSKPLREETVTELLNEISDFNVDKPRELQDGSYIYKINGEPVLFNQFSEEQWLVVYSTALRNRDKKDISDLASLRGWIIEGWIPSKVVNGIYHEFTPGDENVNIQRTWDPYWIYQREGDIPPELSEYYQENIDEFIEREIEFNLKTPRRLVDEALHMGATRASQKG